MIRSLRSRRTRDRSGEDAARDAPRDDFAARDDAMERRAGAAGAVTAVDDSPPASDEREHARSVVRTLTALVSMRAATWLTATGSMLIVPRFLGAHDFGLLAIALAFNDYALAVTMFGARRLVVRDVARTPEATWSILVHAVVGRLATWVVLTAVIAPGILLMPHVLEARNVLLLFLAGVGIQAVGAVAIAALQGRHHLGGAAAFTTVVQTVSQVGVVVVVLLGTGLLAVAGVMVTAAALSAVGGIWIAWRFARQPLRWDSRLAKQLMRGGVPFLLADLAQLVYGQVDVLMLAVMATATDVGNYALAWRLTAIPLFLPVALRGALLPTLSVTALSDVAYFRRLLRMSLRVLLAVTVPISFGIAALAPEAVQLISGGGFTAAVPSTLLLSVGMPLVAVDTVLGGALIASDQERRWAIVGWGSAALNPLMNLVAIPVAARTLGDAAVGAAATTLLTELFMTVWAWRLLNGSADLRAASADALRAIVAGAVMVVAVLLLKQRLGTFGVIPVGAAVYLVGAMLTRLVTVSDVRLIRRLMAGARPPIDGARADAHRIVSADLGTLLVARDPAPRPTPIADDDG